MRIAGCVLLALVLTQPAHARTFLCARAGSPPSAVKQLVEAGSVEEAACSFMRSHGVVTNGPCGALARCEETPSNAMAVPAAPPPPPAPGASAAAPAASAASSAPGNTPPAPPLSNAATCLKAATTCKARCGMGYPTPGSAQDFEFTNCTQRCELIRARCVLSPPPAPRVEPGAGGEPPALSAAPAPAAKSAQSPPPQAQPTDAFTCISPGRPRSELQASSAEDARRQYIKRHGSAAKPAVCTLTATDQRGKG